MAGVVIYTANMGQYDELPPVQGDGYVCFADEPVQANGWDVRIVTRMCQHPKAEALRFKCLPHLWLPDYDGWIWMDAHLGFDGDAADLLALAPGRELAACKHPIYDCVYAEMAKTIEHTYRGTEPMTVIAQREALKQAGYPAQHGLALTALLLRYNTSSVRRFNERWWADICRWSTWRDQFSFDPTCWRMGMTYGHMVENDIREDGRFEWKGHRA